MNNTEKAKSKLRRVKGQESHFRAITALPEPRTLVRVVKAKQGFKLPWMGSKKAKRLKAYERKPWTESPGKLIIGSLWNLN